MCFLCTSSPCSISLHSSPWRQPTARCNVDSCGSQRLLLKVLMLIGSDCRLTWPPLTLGSDYKAIGRKHDRFDGTICHPGARTAGGKRCAHLCSHPQICFAACRSECVFIELRLEAWSCTFQLFWVHLCCLFWDKRVSMCSSTSFWRSGSTYSLFLTPSTLTTTLWMVPSSVEEGRFQKSAHIFSHPPSYASNWCADPHLTLGSGGISGVWMTRDWHLYILEDKFTSNDAVWFPADPRHRGVWPEFSPTSLRQISSGINAFSGAQNKDFSALCLLELMSSEVRSCSTQLSFCLTSWLNIWFPNLPSDKWEPRTCWVSFSKYRLLGFTSLCLSNKRRCSKSK